jgi:hypothetical protein
MAKFLRFIGFMVLALALWQTVSDTFANKAASGGNVVSENTIAVHEQTDAYIAMLICRMQSWRAWVDNYIR